MTSSCISCLLEGDIECYNETLLLHVVEINCCSNRSQPLLWRHNERDCVSNHRHLDYLLNRLFRCIPKKPSKLRVTGHCAGSSPVTREFPAQRVSNAENVSIWWHHHDGTGSGLMRFLKESKHISGFNFICRSRTQNVITLYRMIY